MSDVTIPEGFTRIKKNFGDFSDVLQPMYMRLTDEALNFGMVIDESHINNLKIAHGGVYMTFMDLALSAQVGFSQKYFKSAPTISMSVDFLSSAKVGDFIWCEAQTLRVTRNFAFTQGILRSQEKDIMRASATFKLPEEHREGPIGITLEQFRSKYKEQS